MSSEYGENGYSSGYPTYPATEVRAVPDAQVQLVVAREQYWNASQGLSRTIERLWRDFEASPETQQAKAACQRQWEALQDVQARLMRNVQTDPDYQAASMLRQKLAEQIRDLWNAPNPDLEKINAVATTKMQIAAVATRREAMVMDQDPDIQRAKRSLADAGSRLSAMRQRFQQQVQENPEVASARQSLEGARTAYLASSAYFNGVVHARNIALDYNSDTLKYSPYRYYSPTYFFPNGWWHW